MTENIEIHYHTDTFAPKEPIELAAGMFVKPIDWRYLPKHVKDDTRWKYYDKKNEVFCYTRKGILPISWKYIREI